MSHLGPGQADEAAGGHAASVDPGRASAGASASYRSNEHLAPGWTEQHRLRRERQLDPAIFASDRRRHRGIVEQGKGDVHLCADTVGGEEQGKLGLGVKLGIQEPGCVASGFKWATEAVFVGTPRAEWT